MKFEKKNHISLKITGTWQRMTVKNNGRSLIS